MREFKAVPLDVSKNVALRPIPKGKRHLNAIRQKRLECLNVEERFILQALPEQE